MMTLFAYIVKILPPPQKKKKRRAVQNTNTPIQPRVQLCSAVSPEESIETAHREALPLPEVKPRAVLTECELAKRAVDQMICEGHTDGQRFLAL